MRNLNVANLPFMRPSKVAAWGPVLPFFAGTFGWVMANKIDPGPAHENPLVILSCAVLMFACFAIVVPIIFKWDWRAEYFGAPVIYLSSLCLLSIIPFSCLIFYGHLYLWVKILMVVGYVVLHFIWCHRFIAFYRDICAEHELYSLLYVEEDDAVYYSQKIDGYFFDKLIPFRQLPPDYIFVVCLLIPVALGFDVMFANLPDFHMSILCWLFQRSR